MGSNEGHSIIDQHESFPPDSSVVVRSRSASNSSNKSCRSPRTSWRRNRSQSPINNANADSKQRFIGDCKINENIDPSVAVQNPSQENHNYHFERNKSGKTRSYSRTSTDNNVQREHSWERGKQFFNDRYHNQQFSNSKCFRKGRENSFNSDKDRYNKRKSGYGRRRGRSQSGSPSRTRSDSMHSREGYSRQYRRSQSRSHSRSRSNSRCSKENYYKRSNSPSRRFSYCENHRRYAYSRNDNRSPFSDSSENSRRFSSHENKHHDYKNSGYQLSKERSRSPHFRQHSNSYHVRPNYKYEKQTDSEKYSGICHKLPTRQTYEHTQSKRWNYHKTPSNFQNPYQSFGNGCYGAENFWMSGSLASSCIPQYMSIPTTPFHYQYPLYVPSYQYCMPWPFTATQRHFRGRVPSTSNRPPRAATAATVTSTSNV